MSAPSEHIEPGTARMWDVCKYSLSTVDQSLLSLSLADVLSVIERARASGHIPEDLWSVVYALGCLLRLGDEALMPRLQ